MRTKRPILILIIVSCLAAAVIAKTQISLDTPATLPSDI